MTTPECKNKTILSTVLRTLISEIGDDKDIITNCSLVKTLLSDTLQSNMHLTVATEMVFHENDSKLQNSSNSCTTTNLIPQISNTSALKKSSGSKERVEDNYTGNVIVSTFSNADFKIHFGISRKTMEGILRLTSAVFYQNKQGHATVPMATRLLLCFWMLTTQDSYRSVAERFNLSKGASHRIFFNTCELLYNMIGQVIFWPDQSKWNQLQYTFKSLTGLPEVVAVIGSCHIPIKIHIKNGELYLNDRGHTSVILQGICTSDFKFIDVSIGWPGSVGSEQIFRNSDIYCEVVTNTGDYLPENGYIVGNSAFPLEEFLLTPYHLTDSDEDYMSTFNASVERCWYIFQKSFSLLYNRFKRLQCVDMGRIDVLPKVIATACVLHNMILMQDDWTLEVDVASDTSINYINAVVCNEQQNPLSDTAHVKRDEIAKNLHQNYPFQHMY